MSGIGEENEIRAGIGHPRLMGGRFIDINIRNMSEVVDNNINFIEYSRNPDEGGWAKGPQTLASDFLRIDQNWEPTVRIKTTGQKGNTAVPSDMVLDEEEAEVAGEDREELLIGEEEAGFGDLIHFGATKIKEDSETVRNDTEDQTLVRGEDYEIDYYRGMIELFESAGSLTDNYSIGYIFKNNPRNIAYMLSKIPVLGGPSVFVYDIDEEFVGDNTGFEYTVFVKTARHEFNPNIPNEAEVNLEIRNAMSIDEFEIEGDGLFGGLF